MKITFLGIILVITIAIFGITYNLRVGQREKVIPQLDSINLRLHELDLRLDSLMDLQYIELDMIDYGLDGIDSLVMSIK